MNIEPVSIIISTSALLVSGLTAWFTLFHSGKLKMTRPTLFFFGPDGAEGSPKVYLRALIYCTGRKGLVLENMYLKLSRGETGQNFNVWVYRDDIDLHRGSGLFISREGIVADHHFLLPKDGTKYEFLAGEYNIDVYANIIGSKKRIHLTHQKVKLNETQSNEINKKTSGVFFDWGPDSNNYYAHIDKNPNFENIHSEI